MSMAVERLISMSSFQALFVLLEYRAKYPDCSDESLISMLKRYPDTNCLDYSNAQKLEKIIDVNYQINLLDSLRRILKQIIVNYRPSWMYSITFGRNEVWNNLNDIPNLQQCFKSAHLFDEYPTFEIIQWWDEIAEFIRAENNMQKIQNGREGERLSLEYEKERLSTLGIHQLPKWIALEDNTVGYDIKSYDLGEYGRINKLIEVKSYSGKETIIFLTQNEWQKAIQYKNNYYFHIWHLPSKTLKYEMTVDDMQPFILENKDFTDWTSIQIDLSNFQ